MTKRYRLKEYTTGLRKYEKFLLVHGQVDDKNLLVRIFLYSSKHITYSKSLLTTFIPKNTLDYLSLSALSGHDRLSLQCTTCLASDRFAIFLQNLSTYAPETFLSFSCNMQYLFLTEFFTNICATEY